MRAATPVRIGREEAWLSCLKAGERRGRRWAEGEATLDQLHQISLAFPERVEAIAPPRRLGSSIVVADEPTLNVFTIGDHGSECLALQEALRRGFAAGVASTWRRISKPK